jgi:hypothetical protein
MHRVRRPAHEQDSSSSGVEKSRERLREALTSIETAKTALEVGYAAAYAIGFSDALQVEKQLSLSGQALYREVVQTRCKRRLEALDGLQVVTHTGPV